MVVLLSLGFLTGIATHDVHPDNLLGALYQPFVSIAVAVTLFEAGLRLSFQEFVPRSQGADTDDFEAETAELRPMRSRIHPHWMRHELVLDATVLRVSAATQ
jgi:hypothetical protein